MDRMYTHRIRSGVLPIYRLGRVGSTANQAPLANPGSCLVLIFSDCRPVVLQQARCRTVGSLCLALMDTPSMCECANLFSEPVLSTESLRDLCPGDFGCGLQYGALCVAGVGRWLTLEGAGPGSAT